MKNDKTVTRSKIYTYFYGRNTVFQQFLIVVGILFFILSTVAAAANEISYQNKQDDLITAQSDARQSLSAIREECWTQGFNPSYEEPFVLDKADPGYDLKSSYNNALEKYNKAKEKLENHKAKDSSESFMGGLCTFLGWVSILAGGLWFIYKKISFNKEGQKEYDEELKDIIEEAKKKALDKLNIVAEQVEKVDPVVLSGIATPPAGGTGIADGPFVRMIKNFIRKVLIFDKFIFFLICALILSFIATWISANIVLFVFAFLLCLAAVGGAGYLLYKRYEIKSHVSKRIFKRLNKFSPRFLSKVGSDEVVRVSLPAITVYMFGDDQLYMYYQYIDIVTGKIFCEGVYEYFYEDVVGVTSTQETKKIFKRCGFLNLFLRSIDYLKESITVITSGCTHQEAYIVDIGNSLLDTQFIGMRNLIRQKKSEK